MSSSPAVRSRSRRRGGPRRGGRPAAGRPAQGPATDPALVFDQADFDPTPLDFGELGFDDRLLRAIDERGFVQTTPIQSAAIPLIQSGIDLMGCAQTGTGKTAAFLLPLMQRMLQTDEASGGAPRASSRLLVLAPTRELAVQIEEDFLGFAYHTHLTGAAVYGGVESGPQERALRAPVDVIVATPGRLLDHMNTEAPRFADLEVLVLDEADRMLDMGFWPSVRRIVDTLPAGRQTLFFSATTSEDVLRSAGQIMRNPKMIQIGVTRGPATTISHAMHAVAAREKATWLVKFLRRTRGTTLVFVRTKRGADRLAQRLAAGGIRCAALHADRTQSQRTAAVEGFRAGRYATLVATDVAARGLDIEGIGHVINYDVPDSADSYVHRVGRTGRAELVGIAITLVDRDERETMREIERALDLQLEPKQKPAHNPESGPEPQQAEPPSD